MKLKEYRVLGHKLANRVTREPNATKPACTNSARHQTTFYMLLGIVLLTFSQSARAYNYEGAFYVDSPTAVTTLQNAGFNTFIVPGALPGGHAQVQSVL